MTDSIGMRPAETAREMHTLGQHGQQLETAWQSAKSAIAGNEGGIGNDLLGQAFREVYNRTSEAIRQAADKVPPAIILDADLGHQATNDYTNTDTNAATNMGNIG